MPDQSIIMIATMKNFRRNKQKSLRNVNSVVSKCGAFSFWRFLILTGFHAVYLHRAYKLLSSLDPAWDRDTLVPRNSCFSFPFMTQSFTRLSIASESVVCEAVSLDAYCLFVFVVERSLYVGLRQFRLCADCSSRHPRPNRSKISGSLSQVRNSTVGLR